MANGDNNNNNQPPLEVPLVGQDTQGNLTTGLTPLDGGATPEGAQTLTGTPPSAEADVVDIATIETQAQEGQLAQQALSEGIQSQIQQQAELATASQERAQEDIDIARVEAKEEQEFAAEQTDIIREGDVRQQEIEQETLKLAGERAEEEAARLSSQQQKVQTRQEAEIEVAKQAQALQKIKDDNAIKQAKRDTEVARQKANWAFNKLGLTFSSGAILMTQDIATRGANKLAEIKVQANFNQAKISLEVAKLNEDINKTQLDYDRDINSTINKYEDIQLNVQESASQRVADVQSSLLDTNKQKNDKINDIVKDLKTDIRKNEDDLRKEQERLTNDVIKKSEALEKNFEKQQDRKREELDIEIITGTIAQLTASEITAKETELGLQPGTINAMTQTRIETSLRTMYDSVIGKDYVIGNIAQLNKDIFEGMQQGNSMTEALTIAVSNDLKTNVRFQEEERARRAKLTGSGSGSKKKSDFAIRLSRGDITETEFAEQIDTTSALSAISDLQSRKITKGQSKALLSKFFGIPDSDEGISDEEGALYFDGDKLKTVDTFGFDETVFNFKK